MIKIAKTAGFCYGVKRAVDKVYDAIDEGKKIATLGPIIHNKQKIYFINKGLKEESSKLWINKTTIQPASKNCIVGITNLIVLPDPVDPKIKQCTPSL